MERSVSFGCHKRKPTIGEENMKEHRYFAPMPETEWFSVSKDGRTFSEIVPHKGDHVHWIDLVRDLAGIETKPATLEEHRRNRTKTILHKRIVKCFIKHCEKAGHKHGYGDSI
jgi:hypothetical protein